MHNVEFKAELRDLPLARAIAMAHGATMVCTMVQTDTYFRVPSGRLKRREVPGENIEYIFYERADRTQPKLSHFTIFSESEALERFGVRPLPTLVVVRKSRELLMFDHVRIHLDDVQHLGTFLELEALVFPERNIARCHEMIAELRQQLGPAMGEAIGVSYADMMLGEDGSGEAPGPK